MYTRYPVGYRKEPLVPENEQDSAGKGATRCVIMEITYKDPIDFTTLEALVDAERGYEGVVSVRGRLAYMPFGD